MAKHLIEAFVTWRQYEWEDEPTYLVYPVDMSSSDPAYVVVRKQIFSVEIPDDFDPRPQQIAALRQAKTKVLAEAEAKATNIEEQIQRLLALPNLSES